MNFDVDNKQRAATIVEGGPNVKTVSSFFKRSLTSTLSSECAAPGGFKMFERKRASAPIKSTDSLSMPHDGCTLFVNVSDKLASGCWRCSSVRRATSFACLLAEKAMIDSLLTRKHHSTVKNFDVGIHLFDLEMPLIRFSSKCTVAQWTSHRNGGVLESKKQIPARHTDKDEMQKTSTETR